MINPGLVLWFHCVVFFFCFFSSNRSSDVDSDRAFETRKKKKKKRRHRDGDSHISDAARSHKNRSSDETENRKRHFSDIKDSKHDDGFSPAKRRCTDYAPVSRDHLPSSHHTPPSNGSTHGHLNGFTGFTSF